MRRTNPIRPAPNNNCGPRNICGMRGGLFNPFFQNGDDIAGFTGMGSSSGGGAATDAVYEDLTRAYYEDNTVAQYEA